MSQNLQYLHFALLPQSLIFLFFLVLQLNGIYIHFQSFATVSIIQFFSWVADFVFWYLTAQKVHEKYIYRIYWAPPTQKNDFYFTLS
jgi:hypothetical protein